MMTANTPLSWRTRLIYSLPALGLSLIGIPVYVFLPKFYTDTLGVSISTVGLLLMAVRIFDAVTDPVTGYLSDRTPGPFGRRRPYMAIGSAGLALSVLFLFSPPALPEPAMTAYFGAWLFALFFFWTMVTIPYEALGPELTPDYHERTSLFSIRDGALILGTLLAAAAPVLIDRAFALTGSPASEARRFSVMGLVFAPLILGLCWITVLFIRETGNRGETDPFFKGFSPVLKNRPFIILISGYAVSALGSHLPATLILYYVEYVLKARGAEIFLLVYFLTGILFLPLWMAVSRRLGKKQAWMISMAINTGAFFGVFFLGPGDTLAYGILIFFSGMGFGAGLALPSAIQADVIDYDQAMTGRRREGRYMGLWSIAKKSSAALGVGLGLLLLGDAGYSPNADQGEPALFMLRVLYALVPCLCNVLSMVIISFYPLSEERHARIRRQIESAGSSDPASICG